MALHVCDITILASKWLQRKYDDWFKNLLFVWVNVKTWFKILIRTT